MWSATQLEKRIMLAADVGVSDASGPVAEVTTAEVAAHPNGVVKSSSRSIVFVDPGVDSIESLSDGVIADADLILLNAHEDGVTQITRALDSRRDVDSIHIVSHGDIGQMMLGNSVVSLDTLETNEAAIKNWSRSFSPNADILLYGCDTGAGPDGLRLAKRLAEMTGADVAASNDKTGHATQGGDWDLELNVGTIEAQIAFTVAASENYQFTFASSCNSDPTDHHLDDHDHLDYGLSLYQGPSNNLLDGVPNREEIAEFFGDANDGVFGNYDYSQTFQLNSLPGADHTIHLDFDGHITSGTSWDRQYNNSEPIVTPAFDLDGDPTTFSNDEMDLIYRTWIRVAEDFAPFNINVTTEDPGVEALRRVGANDTQWGMRAVIGINNFFPRDWGGVAAPDSFGDSVDTPTFVFQLDEVPIAETISHEVGHTLGLMHDGTSNFAYYSGHGSGATSWAPIMGNSFGLGKRVTQWSQGEYADANMQEDDLAIIASTTNGAGFRADDHGNVAFNATELNVQGESDLANTTGIIDQNSDVDVFSFYAGSGAATINVDTLPFGGNLDVSAEVYDSNGNLVVSANPANELGVSLQFNIDTAGEYFLIVDGVGTGDPTTGYSDYGSLGNYRVSGNVTSYQTQGQTLEVRAAGTTNNEIMTIEVDGDQIGTVSNVGGDAGAGIFETYTFQVGSDVAIEDIRIAFTNDLYDPANNIDRNLRVDNVTLGGVVYETEGDDVFSTATWLPSDGITPGFGRGETLHANGYFQFAAPTGSTTLVTIDAQVQGDVADLELQVDGVTVETFSLFSRGGTPRDTFSFELQGDIAPESIRVAFTNDRIFVDPISGATIDRNAIVHSITVGDVTFDGSDSNVISTGTWLPQDGVTTGLGRGNTLHSNGYFQLSDNLQTEIVIDANGFGDVVDFELRIAGQTVGNYSLSPRAGAPSGTFTYIADGNVDPEDVQVVFTNDRVFTDPISGATIDRNLQILSVSIGGQVFDPNTQSVFSTGTWQPADGIQPGFGRGNFLHANGYFSFVA